MPQKTLLGGGVDPQSYSRQGKEMHKKNLYILLILSILNASQEQKTREAIESSKLQANKAIKKYGEQNKASPQEAKEGRRNLFDYKKEDETDYNDNSLDYSDNIANNNAENHFSIQNNGAGKEAPREFWNKNTSQDELNDFKYIIPDGAKTLDMTSEINIGFIKGKQSVLILPFIITDYKIDDFERSLLENKKKEDNVDIAVKDNQIIFKSANSGKLDLTVEGGAYPIILHIYFNLKTGTQYVAILDSLKEERAKENNPQKLQADNHTENIVAITDALFNNKKIIGFKEITEKEKYEMPDFGLELIKIKSIAGNGYLGEVWLITNTGDKAIKISEEMFYEDGVFSVSILNEIINSKKTTTIYIVRAL